MINIFAQLPSTAAKIIISSRNIIFDKPVVTLGRIFQATDVGSK